MPIARFVVGGISVILVAGACIALIAGISHSRRSGIVVEDDASTSSKSVSAFCRQTDYKQQCVLSVATVGNNQTATFNDFFRASVSYTMENLQMTLNDTVNIRKGAKNSTQKMAVDDCKELLQFAIDELQASYSTAGYGKDVQGVKDREDDIKNWLSAVMSYQQTCLDGLGINSNLGTQMWNGLFNATQLTSNALAIISDLDKISNDFNIPLPNPTKATSSRKLLRSSGAISTTNYHSDKDGYPMWTSSEDRKLLASNNNVQLQPDAIVAQDGSGQYKTISEALAAYNPTKNFTGRYVVYVKAGTYHEYVTVTKNQVNVFMHGDGPRKTIVTGNKSFKNGITTYKTATFSAMGDGFIAKSMGFQNTAGAIGHQAVALRVQSDKAAFYNCRMDGYQDTLYQQAHRQFYRNCVISGTIDFMFGDSTTIVQNCKIIVRKPNASQKNIVTAHGRFDKREPTGLVIQNCQILPEKDLFPVMSKFQSYLGRPWKEYARTIVMESTIGAFIDPAGWLEWQGSLYLDTLYYAEYGNTAPGAKTDKRVKWKGYRILTDKSQVIQFTTDPFIQGSQWLQTTGFPYFLGLKNA